MAEGAGLDGRVGHGGWRPPPGVPTRAGCTMRTLPLVDGLPAPIVASLDRRLAILGWPRGHTAPAATLDEADLLVVRGGLIALLEASPAGAPVVVGFVGEGEILTAAGLAPEPRALALVDSSVSLISIELRTVLAERHPRFADNIVRALARRIHELRETTAALGAAHAEDRMRARIRQLASRYGVATPAGVRLRLDLRHADWAILVGTSRQTAAGALRRLREAGEVVVEARDILIPWGAWPADDLGALPEGEGAHQDRKHRDADPDRVQEQNADHSLAPSPVAGHAPAA